MEDELYNCLMSEINGNHLDQKQAYETLTDINQLRQMETLPRWDDKEKLLWQSTVAIKSDSVGSLLVLLLRHFAALSFLWYNARPIVSVNRNQ